MYTKYTDLELLIPYTGQQTPTILTDEEMLEIKRKQALNYNGRVGDFNTSQDYLY